MPLLNNNKLSSSSSSSRAFFFISSSSLSLTPNSNSSMGSGNSTRGKGFGRKPSGARGNSLNLNTAMNNNSNQQADPWSPPPYTPEPDPKQPPYSPEDIHPAAQSSAIATQRADDSEYSFLANFDTVFLVDDSGSMAGRSWKEAEEAIAAITPICTQYDPDGIDIHFLNHINQSERCGGYTNVQSPRIVQEIFQRVRPRGMTPVGQRLRQILFPYLRRVEKMAANTDDYGQLQNPDLAARPMNIIVITDGVFSDDAESVILNAARALDRCQTTPWQVGIQFFQIGTDEAARKHLQQLDDELGKTSKNDHVRDIVDTVPWKGQGGHTLLGDGILKVVLGAVNKRLDRQKS